jgi:hypothetical protein
MGGQSPILLIERCRLSRKPACWVGRRFFDFRGHGSLRIYRSEMPFRTTRSAVRFYSLRFKRLFNGRLGVNGGGIEEGDGGVLLLHEHDDFRAAFDDALGAAGLQRVHDL